MLVHFMDLPTWPIAFIWHEHTQVIIQFLIELFCIKTFWLYILLRKKSTVVWRVISSCMCFTLYCLCFTVYCMCFTVYCMCFTVYCMCFTVYCMCFTVYCMYYRRTGYTVKATSMEEKTDFQKQVCSYTDRILKHRLLGSLVVECWHRGCRRSRVQSPVKDRVIPKTL